jgi:hypothetical protein
MAAAEPILAASENLSRSGIMSPGGKNQNIKAAK